MNETTSRAGMCAKWAVWLTLGAVLATGCSPLTGLAFLFNKDTPMPAEYPLRPAAGVKSEKDKELIVLILAGPWQGQAYEFAGADRDLVLQMGKCMTELAKADKQKLAIVPTAQVERFKMTNPTWKAM